MKIAVIPARGGSKRIPRKNVKSFCGKPMIAWSIEAAKASKLFDRIIVSTDDQEIAKVARAWGAETPFLREADLSNDMIGTTPVVAHATQWALDQGLPITTVCCIYATAPFIRADDLTQGLYLLESGNWDYVFTVTAFAAPILRAFQPTDNGGVEMFFPEHMATRSQDMPTALHDAAQFYWGRTEAWINQRPVFQAQSHPLVIPRWRVQDIDTVEDWERAQIMAPAIMGSWVGS
jgi:pseudaminic acid cytidylyltransferase